MVVESTSALGWMGMERVRTLPSSEEDAKPLLAKDTDGTRTGGVG